MYYLVKETPHFDDKV